MAHAPTPWRMTRFNGNRSWTIQRADTHEALANVRTGEEDAAFIVRAVNAHDEMLEALKVLTGQFLGLSCEQMEADFGAIGLAAFEQAKAAISKAERSE